MLGLVESKEVLLTFPVIHVTMQFVDVTTGYHLGRLIISLDHSIGCLSVSISEVTIGKAIPVQIGDELKEEVNLLAVGHKDYDLRLLVREEEGVEVQEAVLGWDLSIKLLNLLRDGS